MSKQWVNNRLSIAIKKGFTLVYDEFTRSRPEANNILLPILQEKMLSTSASNEEDYYMKVHPEFRAIFTSNPEEYAGVNRTQDALRDRMVTMDLDYFDYETELRVTHAKSELRLEDSEKIVQVVRGLRESGKTEFDPTVRGSIMIARTLHIMQVRPEKTNDAVRKVFQDILTSETSRVGSKTNQEKVRAIVNDLIEAYL
jgi:gas vesicle protein GvpN